MIKTASSFHHDEILFYVLASFATVEKAEQQYDSVNRLFLCSLCGFSCTYRAAQVSSDGAGITGSETGDDL